MIRLLRCRSRELVVLLKPCSEAGDSVLLALDKIEDGKLLSLSPASLSRKTDERLFVCDWPRIPLFPACDRGVGHSIGLLETVETATEDCLLSK